jgi:hypothetical protein
MYVQSAFTDRNVTRNKEEEKEEKHGIIVSSQKRN